MPPFLLYPLALLGAITVLAFGVLMVLVLIDHRNTRASDRASHRKAG